MEEGFEYVSPIYTRHKYDGTITNNIVYNLTRSLYGKRIRQPIGGEFCLAGNLAQFFLEQDVWETDVARYGIDIWMTTSAIIKGYKISQARLGVKVHDAKDPAASLGPMFRQVIGTMFSLMEKNESIWKKIRASEPVPTFGPESFPEPDPVNVNLRRLVSEFRNGYQQFGVLWKSIFCPECYAEIERLYQLKPEEFLMSIDTWAKMLYELSVVYHHWQTNRNILVSTMVPLYMARVASFVNRTRDMNPLEAEEEVEEQAAIFEAHKDYLVELWEKEIVGDPGAAFSDL